MYKDTTTWVDLHVEYKDSLKQIKLVKERRKGTDVFTDMVDCEIAGSMESDLTEKVREMKQRVLQEYNSISIEDIINPRYGLTDRQRQVTVLRQQYSCKDVAMELNLDQSTVYRLFETAVNKIIKLKQQKKQMGIMGLSEKQLLIYELYTTGLKPTEIAKAINISINSVKTHLKRIKQKIEGDKTIQIEKTG